VRHLIAASLALLLCACSGSRDAAKIDWLTGQALDYLQGARTGSGTIATVLPDEANTLRKCAEPRVREVIAAMPDQDRKLLADHLAYLTRPRISGPADMRGVLREAENYAMSEAGREGQQLTAHIDSAIAPCAPGGRPAAPDGLR
jgi:hypothetical protein